MTGDGVPLREVFDGWCREHAAWEAARFAEADRRITEVERRVMATMQERWTAHEGRHQMEQAVTAELKVAVRDLTGEIVKLRLFAAKAAALVSAAVVVAGLLVKLV